MMLWSMTTLKINAVPCDSEFRLSQCAHRSDTICRTPPSVSARSRATSTATSTTPSLILATV